MWDLPGATWGRGLRTILFQARLKEGRPTVKLDSKPRAWVPGTGDGGGGAVAGAAGSMPEGLSLSA